jgi:quercetin dioxygenase-like cupin family protein|tara:strand:+ start:1564 stop:2097 length:534 start_codon:yes stop_codon:yes gene_type:complete
MSCICIKSLESIFEKNPSYVYVFASPAFIHAKSSPRWQAYGSYPRAFPSLQYPIILKIRPPHVLLQDVPNLMDEVATRVEVLNDMVEYQHGAVVSRTIVDKPQGSVSIFAFSKGEGLSEHTTPYDALVQVIDGEVEITIGGKSFHLKEGEVIVMPANIPHALRAIGQFKMLLVMVKT